jgi:23S rRNA (uridine2552-2'-O)-methyltransferase
VKRGQDHWGRRAKREGFPSRAIYKIQEIDRRLGLLRPGARVLDLGAAPGSWTLHASSRVGPAGTVVAVDLQDLSVALSANARVVRADVFALDPSELAAGAAFDVVLSDMAPKTTGQRHRDQLRSHDLYLRALAIAEQLLAPGGAFVGKIFQGPDFEAARTATRASFAEVRTLRPDASRKESYEIFLAGLGFRGFARRAPH